MRVEGLQACQRITGVAAGNVLCGAFHRAAVCNGRSSHKIHTEILFLKQNVPGDCNQ
jgi:hypothetical protein